jgi:MOSC domain-containing protein YiiM
MSTSGQIIAVCSSSQKLTKKLDVGEGILKENYGMVGDAHCSSTTHRQVSLLASESIGKMQEIGLDVHPGDFAENITTKGVELTSLSLGTKIMVGENSILEVTQIGKECHNKCSIYQQAGDCIMPKEGIFTRVIKGGRIKIGDVVKII